MLAIYILQIVWSFSSIDQILEVFFYCDNRKSNFILQIPLHSSGFSGENEMSLSLSMLQASPAGYEDSLTSFWPILQCLLDKIPRHWMFGSIGSAQQVTIEIDQCPQCHNLVLACAARIWCASFRMRSCRKLQVSSLFYDVKCSNVL